MNVLIIAHKNPYPPNDGGSMGIYTMIDGLILNNCNVDVLAMNPLKLHKPIQKELLPKSITFEPITIDTNIRIFDALKNLFSKDSYFTSRFYQKNFEEILIKKLKEKTYDIIQFESIFAAVYIDVARKFSNAKIILSAHNIEYQIWERVIAVEKNLIKKFYLTIQKNRLKKFEKLVYTKADGITAVTELDKKEIQKTATHTPIVITPNGMNMDNYPILPFEQQKIKTIFFLGSLDWMPNQQGIVWFLDHVWSLLLKEQPDLHLIIAGKNIPTWLLNRKEKNVTYQSNVPDTKILFQHHAIMICPILSGSGIRVKLIEGLSYGKCIVTTSIGAEGIHYEQNKNIVIADTPKDFCNAIIELIQYPEKIKSIQINARLLAEQWFDRRNVYLPICNLYKELTKNN